MNAQRLRAFLVTVALVLGAGTMSAVAAPLLRGEGAVEQTPTETATDLQTEAATEPANEAPTEPADEATEAAPGEERKPKAAAETKTKREIGKPADTGRDAAKAAAGRGSKPDKPSAAGGKGRGNAHGKAVSDAARGVTPPVGDCRNHGHWVSTVAKGKKSCDDNPRPAHGTED